MNSSATMSASKKVALFIKNHNAAYEAAFGDILADILFKPFLLGLFGLVVSLGALSSYLKSGLWWHPLGIILLDLFLIGLPFLVKKPFFSTRKADLAVAMAFLYLFAQAYSIYAHSIAGTLHKVPAGIYTLQPVVYSLIVVRTRQLSTLLWLLAFALFNLTTLYIASPIDFKTHINPIIQSSCMGIGVNFVVNIVYRYNFYFSAQEQLLKEKAEKISRLFESVDHAIFQICASGHRLIISGEKSDLCESVLGSFGDNADFYGTILQHFELPEDQKKQIEESLLASIGEDMLAFEFARSHLPSEAYFLRSGRKALIEIRWTPLCIDGSTVNGVLVSISDVTAAREEKKKAFEAEVANQKILQLVAIGRDKAFRSRLVFEDLFDRWSKATQLIHEGASAKDCRDLIKIVLHTIKGNARSLGFRALSEAVHDIETHLASKKNPTDEWNQTDMLRLQNQLKVVFEAYTQAADTLGWTRKSSIELNVNSIRAILAQKSWTDLLRMVREGKDQTGDIELFLSPSIARFSTLLSRSFEAIGPILKELGKPRPELVFQGDDIWIRDTHVDRLTSVLPHLFANALDHGIESPAERIQKGKDEQGTIYVTAANGPRQFTLSFSDDGHGLDLKKIVTIAKSNGFIGENDSKEWSDEQKALLIFKKGFSSRSEVSEISGRGIGTSVIKDIIETLGGSVSIRLGKAEPYPAFTIDITLPNDISFTGSASHARAVV